MGETKLCLSVPTRRLRYFESDISRINLHTWQQKVLYNKNKTQNAKSHMTHSVSWSFKRHSLSTFKHWAQALAANERTVRKVCFLLLLLLMGRSRAKNAANKEPELQRPAGKKTAQTDVNRAACGIIPEPLRLNLAYAHPRQRSQGESCHNRWGVVAGRMVYVKRHRLISSPRIDERFWV